MTAENRIWFDRPFQVWLYSVSHKQLLLRSVKSKIFETRVDVLFVATEFINLSTNLGRLIVDESCLDAVQSDFDPRLMNDAHKVFRINGGFEHIVASDIAYHEDGGSYYEPSALLNGTQIHGAG